MHAQLAFDAGFPDVQDGPEPHLPVALDYDVLERALRSQPQVDTPTTHHFGPGTYLRQMFATAGTLVLGREHRGPCMNIMLAGRCVLIDTDGTTREVSAPQMFVSPPGRKLAYVIEDMAWVNIWATDETNIATLERQLFADTFADDMASIGYTVERVDWISRQQDDVNLSEGLTPRVTVGASSIQGTGCFARAADVAGACMGPARLGGKRTRIGRYMNHSRTPNIEFTRVGDDVYAYALRDLTAGEELTVDYRQAVEVA